MRRTEKLMDLLKNVLSIWYDDLIGKADDPEPIQKELNQLLEELEEIKRFSKIGQKVDQALRKGHLEDDKNSEAN